MATLRAATTVAALLALWVGCTREAEPGRTAVPEALLAEIRASRAEAPRLPNGEPDWGFVDLRNVEVRGTRLRVRTAWVEPPALIPRMCQDLAALASKHGLDIVTIEGPDAEPFTRCAAN